MTGPPPRSNVDGATAAGAVDEVGGVVDGGAAVEDDGPRAPLLAETPPLLGVSSRGFDAEAHSVAPNLQQQQQGKGSLDPGSGEEEGLPPVVKETSWPPAWARSM